MKIVIISVGKALCPKCNKVTDWFVDYYRDDDGVKLPMGVECGECGHNLSDEEFDLIRDGKTDQ